MAPKYLHLFLKLIKRNIGKNRITDSVFAVILEDYPLHILQDIHRWNPAQFVSRFHDNWVLPYAMPCRSPPEIPKLRLLLSVDGVAECIDRPFLDYVVHGQSVSILEIVLEAIGNRVRPTSRLLAACRHVRSDPGPLRILMKLDGGRESVSSAVIHAACGSNDRETVELLLENCPGVRPATKEMVEYAAGNENGGRELLGFLLEQHDRHQTAHNPNSKLKITTSMLESAADRAPECLSPLLAYGGAAIELDQSIFQMAVAKPLILKTLLEHVKYWLEVTSEMLVEPFTVSAVWACMQLANLKVLLNYFESTGPIPGVLEFLRAALRRVESVFQVLWDHFHEKPQLTDAFLLASFSNPRPGLGLLVLRLTESQSPVKINHTMLEVAMATTGCEIELFNVLVKNYN
ncbi:uncharacterized protein BDV14DRAFT_205149 [Aspergillus stella-maris]|uniref:uncharacterized protein n=1 Tax=Aspergillus stella-maris TaxID=1810926 RepID=UPI003CCD077E